VTRGTNGKNSVSSATDGYREADFTGRIPPSKPDSTPVCRHPGVIACVAILEAHFFRAEPFPECRGVAPNVSWRIARRASRL
jgi:hypothetical protein